MHVTATKQDTICIVLQISRKCWIISKTVHPKTTKVFLTLHEQAYALYLTCQDWELRHRKINLHFNWSERQNEIGENKIYECYKKKDA